MPPFNDDKTALKRMRKERKNLLARLHRSEHAFRVLTGGAIAVVLLLLLLFGFATDWTRGLRKSNTPPASSNLDALHDSVSGTPVSTAGTTGSSDTSSDHTSSTASTSDTGGGSTTSSTTSTSTTTTNSTPPSGGLLSLYSDSSAGDDISDIIDQANTLGIVPTCHTDLLVQICTFTQNGQSITTKNLIGTGLVTSILKNNL